MHKILVAGAGKIGRLVAILLASTGDYHVFLADIRNELEDSSSKEQTGPLQRITLDITQSTAVQDFVKKHAIDAVVSCLPYFHNVELAKIAKNLNIHYFDLTEDMHVSSTIQTLAKGATSAFVPHCGLAPGFINIVANDMIHHFEQVDSVLMSAGALPLQPHNALKYALTWSTEGLINEYINPCMALIEGKKVLLEPLEGLESIEIDGLPYEIFNTSGGIGTLADSFQSTVNSIHYKTLRYPGHCEKMQFLLNDLKLKDDRSTLKRILEKALPTTVQDVSIIYVAVKGQQNHKLVEETYVKKLYSQEIQGKQWGAIQISTASGLCAVLDIVLKQPSAYHGMIFQESFSLPTILSNRFGQYFSSK